MNNSKKMIIIDVIVLIVSFLFDQLTKNLVKPLQTNGSISIIDDVLLLYYHENRGAAFGILQGQRIFFIFMAIVVFLIMTYVILKIPAEKKYIKLNMALIFILSGALGNTYDRAFHGYVTDFIYFKIIDFPIFNVADIYITVSTFLIILMILFMYKENDLEFLNLSKKKERKADN